ncbi:MAG: hypothetical protein AVDCRST_MAG04-1473, partial [uncultured Acetobacteraceae bacterium]
EQRRFAGQRQALRPCPGVPCSAARGSAARPLHRSSPSRPGLGGAAAAAPRTGRADAGHRPRGNDPRCARRQPVPRRGPPQGL